MANHASYEDEKKAVWKGLALLAFVTLIEVFVSLFGKGYLGISQSTWTLIIAGILLVGFSLYKAYFIVYEFMHMRHEVSALRMTVLLPLLLLIWAIIAFIQEGGSWNDRREQIREKNEKNIESQEIQGDLYKAPDWYRDC